MSPLAKSHDHADTKAALLVVVHDFFTLMSSRNLSPEPMHVNLRIKAVGQNIMENYYSSLGYQGRIEFEVALNAFVAVVRIYHNEIERTSANRMPNTCARLFQVGIGTQQRQSLA